ncbi:MAG: hypothetical protein LDL39_11525 [Magnetospirillum sp.]|nr:hypothetical protein [Magnetospirillum sp.]
MSRLIRLTRQDARPKTVWVNPQHIVYFENGGSLVGAHIYFVGLPALSVVETPEQIEAEIEQVHAFS